MISPFIKLNNGKGVSENRRFTPQFLAILMGKMMIKQVMEWE
jgi:hypothetical protein